MNRELVYSDDAIAGIAGIASYIALTFSEPRADQYLDEISIMLESLLIFPASYPIADLEKDTEIRKLTFQNLTVVLYRFDDRQVFIESVQDARSNWKG